MALQPFESGRLIDNVHFSLPAILFFEEVVDGQDDGEEEENKECKAARSEVWIAFLRAVAEGEEELTFTAEVDDSG